MVENDERLFQEHILGLATAVAPATYQRAKIAYEDARMNGLCHDGAWECALAVIHAIKNQESSG